MINMLPDPKWLELAKSHLGLKETPGPANNPIILRWADELKRGVIHDDATAWCATFTGAMLHESGLQVPDNPFSARAYLELPRKLTTPAVGAIVVFWRVLVNSWEGHVGIVSGKDQRGNLMVISGNHGDAVTCSPYTWNPRDPNYRILGFRWPSIAPKAERYNLPLINSDGKLNTKES